MQEITVLSPHRDDAAFSLCIALRKWTGMQLKLTVINFFTVSAYGPGSSAKDPVTVSNIRNREDRRVLSAIGSRGIRIREAGLIDAPLRLGIEAAAVCRAETKSLLRSEDVGEIGRIIQRWVHSGLLIAPLSLGDHIDHIAVHQAAMEAADSHRLAYFEDLPYAAWTSDRSLTARVHNAERKTRTCLRPAVIRSEFAARIKRRIIARYQSQITPEEGASIARFSARYGGGERLWIPQHARNWIAIT